MAWLHQLVIEVRRQPIAHLSLGDREAKAHLGLKRAVVEPELAHQGLLDGGAELLGDLGVRGAEIRGLVVKIN